MDSAAVSPIVAFAAGDTGVPVGCMEILQKNWILPVEFRMLAAAWTAASFSC